MFVDSSLYDHRDHVLEFPYFISPIWILGVSVEDGCFLQYTSLTVY